jgi:peroxiredoxin
VEPYNCSKRGTVIIDRNGKIAHYEEVPMREARKLEDLEKQVARASA